ncbi:hypothetical protein [Streptomyces sp. NPDC047097]|uniref:hypothetical protein n=1 Tax=Streptomyces sp. NPDC047097 TaxID=3155260 RepID=UPI0033C65D51
MSLTVTPAHLRTLLASPAEDPVLYIDTEATPTLDIWAAAHVSHHAVITHRDELTDWIGEQPTDDDLAETLDELQTAIDEKAAALA